MLAGGEARAVGGDECEAVGGMGLAHCGLAASEYGDREELAEVGRGLHAARRATVGDEPDG